MAVRRITKRWLLNSFSLILVILITIVVLFSVFIRSFFYNSVLQFMESREAAQRAYAERIANDSSADFYSEVLGLVEGFEDRDLMELMALDAAGSVIITSSGFRVDTSIQMPIFEYALMSDKQRGDYQGMVGNENVMAIVWRLPDSDSDLAAMCLMASLDGIDQQIILSISLVSLVAIAILMFVIMSSSYFINSIVVPLSDVGDAARKIAQGDFNSRLVVKHKDEIGDLCDIINYMADELSVTERLKNDFISSVSHELRTPLTAIKGWGETLASDAEPPDAATLKKGMNVIISETQRLSVMVEELLDFSRIQSGRFKLSIDKLDLFAELGEAVIMFAERAKHDGIYLIYDEPDYTAAVLGDKNRLRQVFVNIIDNALKYSDSGDTVTISAELNKNNIVIFISDTGSGISAGDLPHVKNKFYKGDSTRRGSGIGLAVADEIISQHGGTLELSSVHGSGTTVTITVPKA